MSEYKITKYDPEVEEKYRDLLETAREKGILELREPCKKKQIIDAILIACYTFLIPVAISIAMLKCFGLWGFAGVSLFCHTHDISYNHKNIFHQLVTKLTKYF